MKKVPLAKPDFDERELEAVRRVLDSGWVVQGREVQLFENAVAQSHHARHGIAVTSATAALHVCYLALGIGPGDAVFVPSFAWPSAANVAVVVGARPVFVDVLRDTYNIDPENLEEQIEQCKRLGWGCPRAVVPVHQFGLAADLDSVVQIAGAHGLDVVEDAACALGASYQDRPVGTFGRAGVFSFHPRKAITTGEGGVIVTDDDELAHLCRVLRNHGQDLSEGKRDFRFASLNYRMTEIQAAIGRVQLDKLPEIGRKRAELSSYYLDCLSRHTAIRLPSFSAEHTWQTLMVVLAEDVDRGGIIDACGSQGFEVGPGSVAGHCAAVYQNQYDYSDSDLPESAALHCRGLALPLHGDMSGTDVSKCVQVLGTVADRVAGG